MSVAAAIIRRRKQLVRRFAEEGALSSGKAIPFAKVGMRRSWIFKQMVSRGVFVAVGDDRYYMNREAAEEFLEAQRKRQASCICRRAGKADTLLSNVGLR